MSVSNDDSWSECDATRREFLARGLTAGLTVGGAGLIAGCGDRSSPGARTTPAAPVSGASASGTLRVGVSGGGPKETLDAHRPTSEPEIARVHQLYDPLAIRTPDFEIEMVLAESIEPSPSLDLWTVRLRDGITFHDGRPVTADDVLFSLRRIVDPERGASGARSLSSLDLDRSRKLDARTVRLALSRPYVTFLDDLAGYDNVIVPRDYDPQRPIGTGAFKYVSFTPGTRAVFARYPDYFNDPPRVERLEIINYPDERARVDALLSGEVDAITNLSAARIPEVERDRDLRVLVSETGAWQPFTMRVDRPPFDDVRVRQAMRLIIDREAMVDEVLSGQGRVANDLYAPFDTAFAADIPQRSQDLDQARSLLRQAGEDDLRVQLVTGPVYQGIVKGARTLARQAKAAGVTIDVREVDSGTFYGSNYLKWRFAQDFWFTRGYLTQVALCALPDSPLNETHWDDGPFQKLIERARLEISEPAREEFLREAQAIEHDRGGYIIWSFSNQIDAHRASVTGFRPARSGIPLTSYGFDRVAFTK